MLNKEAAGIVDLLTARRHSLAIAESCTGGLIAAELTAVPGCSSILWGAVVSYSNLSKSSILNIKESTLEQFGAVSSATAKSMAWGVRSLSGADWTLAVTGIAGPGGGSEEKPVGTVWLAIVTPALIIHSQRFRFKGNRQEVRDKACNGAFSKLIYYIEKQE